MRCESWDQAALSPQEAENAGRSQRRTERLYDVKNTKVLLSGKCGREVAHITMAEDVLLMFCAATLRRTSSIRLACTCVPTRGVEKADPNGVNPRGKARDNVSIADMKDIALLMVVKQDADVMEGKGTCKGFWHWEESITAARAVRKRQGRQWKL